MAIDITISKYAKSIPKMPAFHLQKEFKEVFDEMSVHTRGRKPEDLLLKRRPNEPDDILSYRTDNFEPITYGSMNKAFDNLYRIVNGVNYTIGWDDDVKKYVETNNFMKNSFSMFFTRIFLKRMIEDPNGFILWLPTGDGLKDPSKPVFPEPVLAYSFNLVDWSEEFVTFKAEDKSIIKDEDGNLVATGDIYYIFSKTSYYTYTQKSGGTFQLEEVYLHNLGVFPIVALGGDLNSEGYFYSFFKPYVAFGNEAVRQFSDWQALSVMAAFPIKEEYVMECEIDEPIKSTKTRGDGKKIGDNTKKYSRKTETRDVAPSVFGVRKRMMYNKDDPGDAPFLPYGEPSIIYYNPDIEYVKNAEQAYRGLLELAEDALHLNLGEISLSGKAKEIDLLSHEDMLGKIFLAYIDAQVRSARIITAYKNRKSYDQSPLQLTRPNTFRIKTEEELLAELSALKTGNAPAMIIAAVARELAARRFSGDLVNQKIFEVIAVYDPLFTYSVTEKQSMVISGTILKDVVTKSNLIYSLLLNVKDEVGEANFLAMPIQKIYDEFTKKVEPYLVAPIATTTDDNGNVI